MAKRALVVALLLTLIGGVLAAPVYAQGDDTTDVELSEAEPPIIIEAADDSIDVDDPELVSEMLEIHASFEPGITRSVASPVASWPSANAVNSGMSVSFDAGATPPPAIQQVILSAAATWDDALLTSPAEPVVIAVSWSNLGNPSLLGSAGPSALYSGGSLPTSDFYPAALVNVLLDRDENGVAAPELVVNLNSNANWAAIDLESVVLHEMGHGLGFLGSGSDFGAGPELSDPPFVFDRLATYNGSSLLSQPNPDSLLTSNNLFIDISSGLSQKLFAPGGWQEGSSYSHFDEAATPPGSPGSLMTPAIGPGETERTLDGPVLGVMAGMGWPLRVVAAAPGSISVAPGNGSATVSWTHNLGATGPAPDGYRVEAWNGPSRVAATTVGPTISSTSLSPLSNGVNYNFVVTPFADGIDGAPASTALTLNGPPAAPGLVAVSGSGLTRTVTWTEPSGGGITSYQVQRTTDGVGWTTAGTTGGLSLAVTVAEDVHQFRVRAINSYGAGSWGYSIPIGIGAGFVRPVALDGQVSRLYQAYFLRQPDAAGFAYWRLERAKGLSLEAISSAFAGSAEFIGTYGSLDNTQFVVLVYRNVLGREPDPGGLALWVGQLNAGVSRGTVMIGFSDSPEFIGNTGTVAPSPAAADEVYRLYVAVFRRFPDPAGFAYWVGLRNSGTSLFAIAGEFASSAEFQQTYGSLTDPQFVALVYNNVLSRVPDAAGNSFWLAQLAAGLSRGAMMAEFSESTEFILVTGTLP